MPITQPDAFPKLLLRNVELFGDRRAIRHKDLDIWRRSQINIDAEALLLSNS
jgi:hypothetical protein